MNLRCTHLTTVHPRWDTRVFHKMCVSLAQNNYIVNLVVADGKGNSFENNVNIVDIGKPRNRIYRILISTFKLYLEALKIRSNLYHLHDPELLFIGFLLKLSGKIVIFDSHEDVPKQILSKYYLNKTLRLIFFKISSNVERLICPFFNGIIAPTLFIENKFNKINKNTVSIKNYPLLKEIRENNLKQESYFTYIGSVSYQRGILQVCDALNLLNSKLRFCLCGNFTNPEFRQQILNHKSKNLIDYRGLVDRNELNRLNAKALCGVVTLLPTDCYVESLPVKLFEYMASGIPVIASDFPLWRSIIEGSNCGILVNPYSSTEIAEALIWLSSNLSKAKKMGDNGRDAVLKFYNWESQEKILLDYYSKTFALYK